MEGSTIGPGVACQEGGACKYLSSPPPPPLWLDLPPGMTHYFSYPPSARVWGGASTPCQVALLAWEALTRGGPPAKICQGFPFLGLD